MTRRLFIFWAVLVAIIYIISAIIIMLDDTYKDVIPLLTAFPAAVLAAVYQKRSSFLEQLRSTWSLLLDAFQDGIQFTHKTNPTDEDFSSLMKKLSIVTDDFRSLFKNIKEDLKSRENSRKIGFYPLESLKDIQDLLTQYYFKKDFSDTSQKKVRKEITRLWKQLRIPLLKEFDRAQATYTDSPYTDQNKTEKREEPDSSCPENPKQIMT